MVTVMVSLTLMSASRAAVTVTVFRPEASLPMKSKPVTVPPVTPSSLALTWNLTSPAAMATGFLWYRAASGSAAASP